MKIPEYIEFKYYKTKAIGEAYEMRGDKYVTQIILPATEQDIVLVKKEDIIRTIPRSEMIKIESFLEDFWVRPEKYVNKTIYGYTYRKKKSIKSKTKRCGCK
jgi:hypothetical protein